MTETLAPATGAEQVRWDLRELYASPDDPRIEAVLAAGLDFAREFEQSYRDRVAQMAPAEFVEMMKSLEEHYDQIARPSLYASLLHTLKTQDHEAGRLVGRIREAGAERGKHMVFFSLELAALTDEEAQRLYDDPRAAVYKHTVEQERKERPHQLSQVEETLLTEISPVGVGSWTRLFEELCAVITAPIEGEEVPLATALSL